MAQAEGGGRASDGADITRRARRLVSVIRFWGYPKWKSPEGFDDDPWGVFFDDWLEARERERRIAYDEWRECRSALENMVCRLESDERVAQWA